MAKMKTRDANKDAKKEEEFKIPPNVKFRFERAEKLLCFHGPLIYEAKCLDLKYNPKENRPEYFIHYAGWNKSWDEWVPESRILKHTDANIQKQRELYRAQKAEPKGKRVSKRKISGLPGEFNIHGNTSSADERGRQSSSATSSQESSSDTQRRKKVKRDPTIETEEQFLSKMEVRVKLPDELKPILVDDWIYITQQRRLLKLPAEYTVDKILEDYSQQKQSIKQNGASKEEARAEIREGIKEYFNSMLQSQLLYKTERKQYYEILEKHPNSEPSQIYGPTHLLRLFVRIGCALAYTRINDKTVQIVLAYLQDFLRFMAVNIDTYYTKNSYTQPTPVE